MRCYKRFLFVLCCLALTVGCASLNTVRFTVEPSALDYAQFRISRPSPVNGKTETVRIDLSGSGFLEMTTGQSERVTDSFWQQSDDPTWQDLHRAHDMLSQDETTAVFQKLVNLGLFDRRQPEEKTPPPHNLAILAQVGFKKQLIVTSRQDYQGLFNRLEQRCRNPAR